MDENVSRRIFDELDLTDLKKEPEMQPMKYGVYNEAGNAAIRKCLHSKYVDRFSIYVIFKTYTVTLYDDPTFYLQRRLMLKKLINSLFSQRRKIQIEIELIKHSRLFDSQWYLSEYPDVKNSGQDPLLHYLQAGGIEGRLPSRDFDSSWYLNAYEDVKASGINPLVHYVKHGMHEGRLPHGKSKASKQSKANTHSAGGFVPIKELERRLWGGFSELALVELKEASRNKKRSNQERASAFYILGRWFSTNYDFEQAYASLKSIRALDLKFYRSKKTKLLLVESLLKSGQDAKALDFIKPTLDNGFDSDFICALSNMDVPDEERLSTLNQVYTHYNLGRLSFIEQPQGMKFGNLTVSETLMPFEGGPKISILVPVYNAASFIEVAMGSLLQQTWRNIEIIAVDDCSSDNSFALLKKMASNDKRLKIFKNDENLGAYGTRNIALSNASGDFVTVHDSDDWSHPQMLEVQLGAMMSNPLLKVTCSMMTRVNDDMRFILRPQRNNLEYIHRSYPSVLIRKKDLDMLGQWDGVSANADDEFVQRARIMWGKESVVDVLQGVPLSFFLVHENSLTQNRKTSLNSLTFGIRHEYSRQANYWKAHKVEYGTRTLFAERKSLKKPFPIPAGLAPNNWPLNKHYDIVIISDLGLLGGTRRCNEGYINAALESGLRVGLFHWPRYDLSLPKIADEYTELSYNEGVDFLVHEDEISADLVLIHHPPILKYEIDSVPKIDCKQVAVLVNQSPMQLWSEKPHYYNEKDVNNLCARLFGREPIWIAISGVVKKTLKLAGGGNNLYDEIWYPPYPSRVTKNNLNVPDGFGTKRNIVIGRHSRDHWTKWPESEESLKAAYCCDTKGISVRLLGGARTPKNVLKVLPDNWEVFSFDSLDITEFIHDLDFFLHFTHNDYIEEFGRNIMEAMANSRVVLLPVSYQDVFADAAIYCEPKDVESVLTTYWADPQRYEQQALRGLDFVIENCDRSVVMKKLAKLIGKRKAREYSQ